MSWLKGTRTDGFINIDKNVNFRGTVKGAGDGIMRPKGALDFYVDGTDGSDNIHSGKSWDGAFKTIQVAIAAQIAQTEEKGDVIWIAPGTYEESLTGDLSKVQVIGATCGGTAHAVSIRPTESYSYTGSIIDAAFRNIMFMSPKTSQKTYPAILLNNMRYSIIDGCAFIGRDSTCVEGLQIGPTADNTTTVNFDFSAITNNTFDSFYGTNVTFAHAIKLGTLTGSNGAYRQAYHSLIAGNTISARTNGIWLGCDDNGANGTVIRNNYIGYGESGDGCSNCGIGALGTLYRLFVADNYIAAEYDGLLRIDGSCTYNNFITLSGADVVTELPVRT